jgi:hypothetical protein
MELPIMNEKPFEHSGCYGTMLTADRCDFKNGAQVVVPKGITQAQDMLEIGAYHSTRILPKLNGFHGYDAFGTKLTLICVK